MNRNRKGVMPEITRAMYKDIKEVYAALDQVKGIGPKVMERIHAALDPLFQEEKR